MFLSVLASRNGNFFFWLRPGKTPVSAHKAPSAESTASPAANEYSQSCGVPKFQLTPLSFFKPNLSAPKAPLCTPVSCTEESSSNRVFRLRECRQTRLYRGAHQKPPPPAARQQNKKKPRSKKADPPIFGLFQGGH